MAECIVEVGRDDRRQLSVLPPQPVVYTPMIAIGCKSANSWHSVLDRVAADHNCSSNVIKSASLAGRKRLFRRAQFLIIPLIGESSRKLWLLQGPRDISAHLAVWSALGWRGTGSAGDLRAWTSLDRPQATAAGRRPTIRHRQRARQSCL